VQYQALAVDTAVALLAPNIFRQFTEYPLALTAVCVLGLVGWFREGAWELWTKENFYVRVPLMAWSAIARPPSWSATGVS